MTYESETTGAISKAIRELTYIANMADNVADYEKLAIIATNAAAELDKLTNNVCRITKHVFVDGVCVQCGTPTIDKLKEISNQTEWRCPVCYAETDISETQCHSCGTALDEVSTVCPTCGGNEVLFEGSERQQPCPDCQGAS